MKRTLTALITLFAVTAARAADITTTFHFSPSLSQEANPIVAQFGAGASTLVLTNVIAVFVFLFVPLFFYWRFPATPLQSIPANVREYICLQLYGRILLPREFICAILLGVPLAKNGLQVLRLLGIAASWTVVFGSFLAVFAWWAICSWHWHSYEQFHGVFAIGGYPTMDVILCVAFFYLASSQYFRGEFSSLRNELNA